MAGLAHAGRRGRISPNTPISAAAFFARRAFAGERIETCVFVGPARDAGDWNVVKALFAADTLDDEQRRMLLSGKAAEGVANTGPIVCACFGVGRNSICDAIAARRAVGRATSARQAEGRHQLRLVHSGDEAPDRAGAASRTGSPSSVAELAQVSSLRAKRNNPESAAMSLDCFDALRPGMTTL